MTALPNHPKFNSNQNTQPLSGLQLDHIMAWYGASHILHGVSFNLNPGQSMGILGRNGMGKTTLVRSIMGLVPNIQGHIYWQGRNITHLKTHIISSLGIAYVPEGRGIFPSLNVVENLTLAARYQPNQHIKNPVHFTIDHIFNLFPRLKERSKNQGQQLSGGEQQMLSIARALMTHPQLLILDEATEGLAPLIMREIWQIVEKIKITGMSIILIDRDWKKILQNTDHGIVIQKGQVVLNGLSGDLLKNPRLIDFLGL